MPLIIFSGLPSSGKTTRALELQKALEAKIASSLRKFKVHIVSDDTLGINREVYRGTSYPVSCLRHKLGSLSIRPPSLLKLRLIVEAKNEKAARGTFYSAIQRLLSKDDIVIADGMNYIKGFRYQLFCEAKALSTPHCVVPLYLPTPILKDRSKQARRQQCARNGINPTTQHPIQIKSSRNFFCGTKNLIRLPVGILLCSR